MSRKDWTVEKLFFRLINNKSDKTYWDNIRAIRARPSKEVFDSCIEFTKSENLKERLIGVHVLAQLGMPPRPFQKEILRLFFQLLEKENDSQILSAILYGIGHNNEKLTASQIEHLIIFKNHFNTEVREALVFALLGVASPKAIDTLIALTRDKRAAIRDWATFGVGTLIDDDNETIREVLWDRTNDKNKNVKLEAIAGLVKRKVLKVKEIIKRELNGGEFGTILFDSIQELNDKEFIPLLESNLEQYKDDKNINPAWIEDLRYCLKRLKETSKKTNAQPSL
jgi:HEAT repeat protein